MEKIIYNNTLIAVRVKKFKNGVIPLTDPLGSLQILSHKRKAGEYTKAHIHMPKVRVTQTLQECLVVIKGKIKIDLYDPDKKFIKSIFLSAGQAVIFMNGGHGVQMVKDSEIVEIKNGPFAQDKVLIE